MGIGTYIDANISYDWEWIDKNESIKDIGLQIEVPNFIIYNKTSIKIMSQHLSINKWEYIKFNFIFYDDMYDIQNACYWSFKTL